MPRGAGLTVDHLTELRRVLHDAGLGKQGHSRSVEENARALLHIHSHQQLGLCFDAAVKAAAKAELASPSTLRNAATQFLDSGALTSLRSPVSRSHPLHPFYFEGVEPSNILTELYHSCALIFNEVCVDDITPADYHDTINGEKFIGWMQQRLFPTFQQLYPGKKMHLVLDNAKYHHHRGPDWFSPSNKKRGQLADFLRQREVKSITVDGATFPVSKFSADARGKGGGPTLAQLKTAVKQHLATHPEINTTVPQQLMEDQDYELLYTPPYISDLQPIEMIWAFTKALVARQSHRTRSAHTCAVQTREAMEQVTAELCQKQIQHCHAWIERFMQSEEGGSLRQFNVLHALLPLAAALIKAEDATPPAAPPAEENEEEQDEASWTQ